MRITGDGVRFRTTPFDGTVLGLLYRGETLRMISVSNGWFQGYSSRLGRTGWVSSFYATLSCT